MVKIKWRKILCSQRELNLAVTLTAGQSFRWQKKDDNVFQGVFGGYLWSLKQTKDALLYYVHNEPISRTLGKAKKLQESKKLSINFEDLLQDYFQLNINLSEMYSQWTLADVNFGKVAENFPGIRILRQDPVENLISFICSSNNNIPRITSMVEKLCQKYGREVCHEGDKPIYSFPEIDALAQDHVEAELRASGFGYRAKFINQCAKHILEKHPPGWLESLRRKPYKEAHLMLMDLPGVGAKVADCVCLMSLDKPEAIPVDTHVWQITVRDYLPHLKTTKSLTDRIYQQIGDFYREKFGEYAGWANTVLFAADLRQFKNFNKTKKGS